MPILTTNPRYRFSAALSLLLLCTNALIAQPESDSQESNEPPAVDPQVTEIVFFNTGIAQVIRSGTVADDQQLELRFAADKVDDVLKSLVIEDSGGGKIRSVEFQTAPSESDIAASKQQTPLTMAQLLQKNRGQEVVLALKDSELSGSIFSVENRQKDGKVVEMVTLFSDSRFESVAIEAVESLRFADQSLNDEFALAMDGLAEARLTETRQLNLKLEGNGQRNVRLGYVVDATIWRMSYRMDISGETGKLQGWAHIDNSSTNDWKGVAIELRSGWPQSFHADLFHPIAAKRDSVGISVFEIPDQLQLKLLDQLGLDAQSGRWPGIRRPDSLGGVWLGGGGGFGGGGGGGFGAGGIGGGGGFGGGFAGSPRPRHKTSSSLEIDSSVEPLASQGRVEKMVSFRIADPVTLAAGKSAMLPVITAETKVELLTQFDDFKTAAAPKLIARIENAASEALLPGPVAVFRDGRFVGDAAMPRVDPKQQANLGYGIDQQLTIEVESEKLPAKVISATVDSQTVTLEKQSTTEFRIKLKNLDSEPRTVRVMLPRLSGELGPAPKTQSNGQKYLQMDLAAYEESNSGFKQVQTRSDEYRRTDISRLALPQWTDDGANFQQELRRWLERREQLLEMRKSAVAEYSAANLVVSNLKAEQSRLVEMVASLNADDPPRAKFVARVGELEADIKTARQRAAKLREALESVNQYISNHENSD